MLDLNLCKCDLCGLRSENMKRCVPGKGNTQKGGIVIVGEAPGEEEVQKKTPFVGYSGKLIRAIFKQVFPDEEPYFTNACLCRPPDNRTPSENEIHCCNARLREEILQLEPRRILLLGATGLYALTGNKSIMNNRGRYFPWEGIPTIASYHPAYIARVPEDFRDLLHDVEKLKREPNDTLGGYSGKPFVNHLVLNNIDDATTLLKNKRDWFTVDIETTSRVPHSAQMLSVGFTYAEHEAVYLIPKELFETKRVLEAFSNYKNSSMWEFQNANYEYSVFRILYGMDVPIDFDTMLGHYILDERSGDDDSGGKGGSYHGLKTLARQELDLPDWSDVMKPYHADFGQAPKHILYLYQAIDVMSTKIIGHNQRKLITEQDLWKPYNEVILPAIKTLADMEIEGTLADKDYFAKLEVEWKETSDDDVKKLRVAFNNPELNPRSHKQVASLLFDEMGLKKIKGRGTSTKKVIPRLIELYPDIEGLALLGNIRKDMTILSTYIKGIPKRISPKTGKLHTRFLIHGTDTGRLASRNPNLQNIPARLGSAIRDGFIAGEGEELVNIDYRQLEFRVWASFSKDPNLCEFINSGRNIHMEIGSQYFNCKPEELSKGMVLDTKAVVFGIVYQRTSESIAKEFKITNKEAQRRIDVLKAMFPIGFEWVEEVIAKALADGYTESMFGRKRRFPFVTNRNLEDIRRQAVNTPISSTASDICLNSAVKSNKLFQHDCSLKSCKPLILVHDSFMFKGTPEELDLAIPQVVSIMETDPFPTPVKFEVAVERGTRWGSLEKYKL